MTPEQLDKGQRAFVRAFPDTEAYRPPEPSPAWLERQAAIDWAAIPDDLEELRQWMNGEPINPIKPEGDV